MNRFKQWQEDKPAPGRQMLMLLISVLIFPTGIPAVLVLLLPQLDKRMGVASFYGGSANIIIGLLAVLSGVAWRCGRSSLK